MIVRYRRAMVHPYASRTCPFCQTVIKAPVSRLVHVFGMHVKRCKKAKPAERAYFMDKGRWQRPVK